MSTVRNVIIIGSGPAGLTAAIYASRANLKPLLIEGEPNGAGDQPGGQLMNTTEIENFPGAVGVQGPELMGKIREQAITFGTEVISKRVTKVDFSSRPYGIWVGDDEFRAETVIISTGAKPLMLGLDDEWRLMGRGVSTCATCDGFFFRGKDIAVVGGGDAAMEEAIFLTNFANSVTIVHRRDKLRASQVMADRAMANEKIKFAWSSELFVDQLDLDATGYIVTNGVKTSRVGVFACGDVQDKIYRQAITSAGTGCMAALDAQHFLEQQETAKAAKVPAAA